MVPRATSRGPNEGALPVRELPSGAMADSAAASEPPWGFLRVWLPPVIRDEGSGGRSSAGAAKGAIRAAMTADKSAFLIFRPPPRAS